jgi:hypothetical protein
MCGGSNAITISKAYCEYSPPCKAPPRPPGPGPAPPPGPESEFSGCILPNATMLPYCDPKLSDEARVDDLVSRLTLKEKIAILSPVSGF